MPNILHLGQKFASMHTPLLGRVSQGTPHKLYRGADFALAGVLPGGIDWNDSVQAKTVGIVTNIPLKIAGDYANVSRAASQIPANATAGLPQAGSNIGQTIPNLLVPTFSQAIPALGYGLGQGVGAVGAGVGTGVSGVGQGLGQGVGGVASGSLSGLGQGLKSVAVPVLVLGAAAVVAVLVLRKK